MCPPVSACRFLVIRHGDVVPPRGGPVYGDLDVPLSELGLRQSAAAAERIAERQIDAIYSSDLARAVHLAECVSATRPKTPIGVDTRLREIHRGHWAGLPVAEIEARWPGEWDRYCASKNLLAPPGGESVAAQAFRVGAALDELASRYAGLTVAICAHLWVLRIATVIARSESLEQVIQHEYDKCAQIELDWVGAHRQVSWIGSLGSPEL
ncbi:MAG: broad specificity phosphatase PhoE [Planctomycetota bacterium]|jgi:broad specificity phosphatase PhoE